MDQAEDSSQRLRDVCRKFFLDVCDYGNTQKGVTGAIADTYVWTSDFSVSFAVTDRDQFNAERTAGDHIR